MDAMGANISSTIAEGVAPFLAELTGARVGLRIVSNLCVERMVTGEFRVPVKGLEYKKVPGEEVAARIIEATEWAQDDVFRYVFS